MHRRVAIIPARLGSTRFPAKVLADRTGKPLVQHVHEAAKRSKLVDLVAVATDDEKIRRAVEGFGGTAVMTRADHPNGSSRLAEAARALGLQPRDVVVNVQGDEPELEGEVIDLAIRTLEAAGAPVATLAAPFDPADDPSNPNIVKVVRRTDGCALYFSRSLIPHPRNAGVAAPLKHVGLYAYRAEFLWTYVTLSPTPLEQAESLEQLRMLEHGHAIAVATCTAPAPGIDTPEQYDAFVRRHLARENAR